MSSQLTEPSHSRRTSSAWLTFPEGIPHHLRIYLLFLYRPSIRVPLTDSEGHESAASTLQGRGKVESDGGKREDSDEPDGQTEVGHKLIPLPTQRFVLMG